MNTKDALLHHFSNAQLLAEVQRLARSEHRATAALIRALAELDERRLYLAEGFSSLFSYCTQVLHLSEHAAYGRIEAARCARKFPNVLALLEQGIVTLTTITLLAPHLTEDNCIRVLDLARHKSKRGVECIVAELRPAPDVPSRIRRLPTMPTAGAPMPNLLRADVPLATTEHHPLAVGASAHRPIIAPLAPERFRIQLTVSRETHDRLRRAQDLLRHAIPNGDPAEVIGRALSLLVERLERDKCASTSSPRALPSGETISGSRHIPAAVRREVWARDDGQCAFVGSRGRCAERGFLEFHHVVPFAVGGAPDAENIELRCRAHNNFEAQLFFGTELVRERSSLGPVLGPDRARDTANE
jgi:5-methylcytosine-specific restriction endonuclease McrA